MTTEQFLVDVLIQTGPFLVIWGTVMVLLACVFSVVDVEYEE